MSDFDRIVGNLQELARRYAELSGPCRQVVRHMLYAVAHPRTDEGDRQAAILTAAEALAMEPVDIREWDLESDDPLGLNGAD